MARRTREESFEETQHDEEITDRILLLDGLLNYQRLFSLGSGRPYVNSSRQISPSNAMWQRD